MTDISRSHPVLAVILTEPPLPREVGPLGGATPGKPTTPAEARELASITSQLSRAPAPKETERFGAATLCQSLPRGNGSREVFLKLAQRPEFWSRMNHAQRGLIAKTLGKAKTSVDSAKLGKAYSRILPNVLFEHAHAEGKNNALTQPERAIKLLHYMSFRSHRLSGDPNEMREVAWRHAQVTWNTLHGQRHLAIQLFNVANEVLTRAFEDRPILKAWKGESEWYGERFTNIGGSTTWALAAHEYMKTRIDEELCGLFQGDRSHCARRTAP